MGGTCCFAPRRTCERQPAPDAEDIFQRKRPELIMSFLSCCYTHNTHLPAYYVVPPALLSQPYDLLIFSSSGDCTAGARCLSLWWAFLAGAGQPRGYARTCGVPKRPVKGWLDRDKPGSTPRPGVTFEKSLDHRPFLYHLSFLAFPFPNPSPIC